MLSLVKAATEPRLLGATINWWPRQLELLASLDGAERLHVWSIGRQAGKSQLGGGSGGSQRHVAAGPRRDGAAWPCAVRAGGGAVGGSGARVHPVVRGADRRFATRCGRWRR